MDLLTVLEPQLAIPVVGAVVCAVLVYMFGFQQTQEPSYEHLAVLHNRPKRENVSNSSSTRQQRAPTSPQAKSTTSGRSKDKAAAAAPASPKKATTSRRSDKSSAKESPKEKASVDVGSAKAGKGKRATETPKESPKKKGKQVNTATATDDLGGDWTSVPTRKSKIGRSKKD